MSTLSDQQGGSSASSSTHECPLPTHQMPSRHAASFHKQEFTSGSITINVTLL